MRTEHEVTAYDFNSALKDGANRVLTLLVDTYEERIEKRTQHSLWSKDCIDPACHTSDVIQETFLTTLLFLRKYENGLYKIEINNPPGLLYAISDWRIYDHFKPHRCRERRSVYLEDLDSWASDNGRFEKQIYLKQECEFLMALAGKILSKDYQNALEDIMGELTESEKAKKRGISLSKAKLDKYRALRKFRQALEGLGILGGENNE